MARDLFEDLDELARRDRFDEVERRALDAIEKGSKDADDLWRYVAWARFEEGRLRESEDAAKKAKDPLFRAKALFHMWRFADAEKALEGFDALGVEDDKAEAEWYRGLCREFRGKSGEAHFRRAAALSPHLFHAPVRLSDREVDAVIEGAIAELPPEIREALEETIVEVRPLPAPHPDVDPLTLGLYHGRDRLHRTVEVPPELPPKVEIYRQNIERIAHDREEAKDELRITLLHELAHHLGYGESDLPHEVS